MKRNCLYIFLLLAFAVLLGNLVSSSHKILADTSPSVFISGIPDDSEVYGNLYNINGLSIANDSGSISSNQLLVDNDEVQTLTSAPLNFSLDTLSYSDGTHTISIKSTDDQNDITTTSTTVYISNGDLNNDGAVNISDLAILANNWGMTSGATYAQGSITGDGAVNISDLAILANNWDWSTSGQVTSNYNTGVLAGITPGSAFESLFESMNSSEQSAVIAQMKTDGVSWLRLDVDNGFPFDTFLEDAVNAGIHVDAILEDADNPLTPTGMASYATAAVAHLQPMGIKTYEILNEPNGCEYSLSASAYTAILQSAYVAIKTADPNAYVLTAGLCPQGGSNEPYTYLTAMYANGAQGYFDAFNMHPYSYPDTPLQISDNWNPWSYLSELHSIMASNGDSDKQIWYTEFGCPTGTDGGYPADCTDSTLAQQITDAFTSARSYSWSGPFFIYNWQDDPTHNDGDFGLYTSSGAAKPDTVAAYMAEATDN